MAELSPRSQLVSLANAFCTVMSYPSLHDSENKDIYEQVQKMDRIFENYSEYGFNDYNNSQRNSLSSNAISISSNHSEHQNYRQSLVKAVKPNLQTLFWCLQNSEDEGLTETVYDFIDIYQEIRESAKRQQKTETKQQEESYSSLLH